MGVNFLRSRAKCALALAAIGLLAPGAALAFDADADGVRDGEDNCLELANPSQRDADADGFGNACDADFNQDGIVSLQDYIAVRWAVGAHVGDPAYDARLDLDGDGVVGIYDLAEAGRLLDSTPGPSGLSCAGEVPCPEGVVRIDLVEQVLSRAARLTWRAASPAIVVKVERRSSGGAWEHAALLGSFERAFVDQGPTGRGLPPGTYEYRVSGGGRWSEPLQVEIREECAGQPPTSPLLPVVEIVDHEPDGDHDGKDVEAALAECSRLRGCVLRALPVVYEDVNAELALHTGYDFSNGLVIEGYGSATVFRSRIFSERDHDPSLCANGALPPCYRPRPVFSIFEPSATPLDGVRFRNFHIEGRKREQPDPGMRWDQWQHWGIVLLASTPESTDAGCVHNVAASGLMNGGLGVQRGRGWIFEYSIVHDVGCQDDLTPCDALERTPEYLTVPGAQSPGNGIVTGTLTEGTVVRFNRVLRAQKYGIAAFFGASRFHIHDNAVETVGGAGIGCNSCDTGVIERNLVRGMHYPSGRNASWPGGYGGELAQGILCVGAGHHVSVLDNMVIDGEGSGVRMLCSGSDLLVQGNAIVRNCRKYGNSVVVADGQGTVLRDNVVTDHPGGCTWSVLVTGARDARIEDGTIESGTRTAIGVFAVGTAQNPTTGLVLRNLRITGQGSGTGVYLAPTSSGTTLYDSTCTSGFQTPLYDGSAGATTRPADPAGACSP